MRPVMRPIPDFLPRTLLVAVGGALGVSLRGFTEEFFEAAGLPAWEAVMLCNLVGSCLIGAFYAALDPGFPRAQDANVLPEELPGVTRRRELLAALFMTGALGGLTTFSTFSMETVQLLESARFLEAGGSALASLALGLAGVALGVTFQHRRATWRHRRSQRA